jgi:hypothetical protein
MKHPGVWATTATSCPKMENLRQGIAGGFWRFNIKEVSEVSSSYEAVQIISATTTGYYMIYSGECNT